MYCCQIIWSFKGIFVRGQETSALASPRTIDCPTRYHRLPRSILMVFKILAYGCHCSVDTELIDRKNNAINCINCILICGEMKRQLSSSFTFQLTPGQWCRCTEDKMSAFCEFQQHFFRNMVPGSLWTVLGRIPLFLGTWSNK